MDERRTLGSTGESLAADLYRRLGFRIVDRNWRCRSGELDLVVASDDLLVFCEVKTRRSDFFGSPAEAVGYYKQARLRRLAAAWMNERRPGDVNVRFDVVSVVVGEREPLVTHLPDAF
ncbi:MAG: YraN family protein [Actinomycetota bacterium]